MEHSAEIGKIALALSKAQSQFEGAAKTSDNPFFKSKYADLHECIEAVKKPLADNELSVIQTTECDEKGIWVHTMLAHSSGEWFLGKLLMKPKKDDDQGLGSSITYGRRYGYAAIVGLAQKDDDGNESVKEPTPKKETKKAQDSKPKQEENKPEKEQSPSLPGREYIDSLLTWVDGFIPAKGKPWPTPEQFTASWNGGLPGFKKNLSPEFFNELEIAYKDTLRIITENQGGKS